MIEQITLHNFCGFQEFSLDAREFTLLVGPNSGGKTTVLRAIEFCVDAYRAVLMPEGQPVLERSREPAPRGALDPIAQTGGVSDPTSLYFQRRPAASSECGHGAAAPLRVVAAACVRLSSSLQKGIPTAPKRNSRYVDSVVDHRLQQFRDCLPNSVCPACGCGASWNAAGQSSS
ncbi:AAA family ATPase [Maioricimonas rarisocia]|uniref:AAA family ATPase n=1 Tax=Maioricimonas rarisocia TaxID=2528026 RepID=UPI0011A20B96